MAPIKQGVHMPPSNAVKSDIAYTKLLQLIISGEALPGSRLVMADLQEKLGLGRTPIREALIRLTNIHVVRYEPYKGAIVERIPSLEEMELIYKIRLEIEPVMARKAVEIITQADIEKLIAIQDGIALLHKHGENITHKEFEYYQTLYTVSGMGHIAAISNNMLKYIELFYIIKAHMMQTSAYYSVYYHKLTDAIEKRDVENVSAILTANLNLGLESVRSEMARLQRK